MRAQILTESVQIEGRTLFGRREGSIRFEPFAQNHQSLSWTWNGVPLHKAKFLIKLRQITLVSGKDVFQVFEHIGVLAMGRLRGVNIVTNGTIPYFPHAGQIRERLGAVSVECSSSALKAFAPVRESTHFWKDSRNRFIRYRPTTDGKLTIEVVIDYPDIGKLAQTYTFPDDALLARVCSARSLGRLPPPFIFLEKLAAESFSSLPIIQGAAWKHQFEDKAKLLKMIADHRCMDILGALSLATPPGFYLAGHIHSRKGGHDCDLKLVQHLRGKSD